MKTSSAGGFLLFGGKTGNNDVLMVENMLVIPYNVSIMGYIAIQFCRWQGCQRTPERVFIGVDLEKEFDRHEAWRCDDHSLG